MQPLNCDSYPDQGMYFGLVLQLADSTRKQFHAAAVYRHEGMLKIGDLQFHLRTRCAPVEPIKDAFWIAPDISLDEQRMLAAKIDVWLTENKNKIPYSVANPGGVLFEDDVWVGNRPGQGLTCSTFIVELFNELSIPFLDVKSWLPRDHDEEWARSILKLLQTYCNLPEDHVEKQKELIGTGVRVRPTDVFAAGMLINQDTEDPLSFEEVAPKAEELEQNILP